MGRRKGSVISDSQRLKISATMKKKFEQGEIVRDSNYWEGWHKTREENKEETRLSYVKAAQKRNESPEYKKNLSEALTGRKFSEEGLLNIRTAAQTRRERNSNWYPNVVASSRKNAELRKDIPNTKAKEWWEGLSDEEKDEHLSKIQKAQHQYPNKFESELLNLLIDWFPEEQFKYVGDLSIKFGGKNPDFINAKQDKIIEGYGEYYHTTDEVEPRIQHFSKYGFDTIIVWHSEMKDKLLLKEKLQSWLKRPTA